MTSSNLTVREATLDDADILNEIEIVSRPSDPSWTYRYPHRDKFPEDHHHFNRLKYVNLLSSGSKVKVMLAECPSLEDPAKRIPIALSIWDVTKLPGHGARGQPKTSAPTPNIPRQASPHQRRDESRPHLSNLLSTHARAQRFFFDESFALDGYIYCQVLATHPAYQGRGAATALCRWGMDRAKEQRSKMCIISSQEDGARRLYDGRLGFVSLGAAVARVDREDHYVRMEALGWDSTW